MFRLGLIMVLSLMRPRLSVLGESLVHFRVLPGDLDLNGHMNNARYLWHMDMGRADLTIRNGMIPALLRRHWMPLVGSAMITYRRSLRPFQRYAMRSRVLGWDEKWFYFHHTFERDGPCAQGMVKAVFRGAGKNIPPSDVLAELGWQESSPALPPNIQQWGDAEAAQRVLD